MKAAERKRRKCAVCGRNIPAKDARGRSTRESARYCSKKCRGKAASNREAARWVRNRGRLLEQRRQSYAASDKRKHAERMRAYMREYRARKRAGK